MSTLLHEIPRRELFAELINAAGGQVVEDRFVQRPAVFDSINRDSLEASPTFFKIFERTQIDTTLPFDHQLAEWLCWITNGNFNDPKILEEGAHNYVHRIAKTYNHHSVVGNSFVPITIMGVSVDAVAELLAHRTGWAGRTTSRACLTMEDPLYRVMGPPLASLTECQDEIARIREFIEFKKSWPTAPRETSYGRKESRRRLDLGAATVMMTIGMTIPEWSWLLSGRMKSQGNEAEVRELAYLICQALREQEVFCHVIKPPEEYGWKDTSQSPQIHTLSQIQEFEALLSRLNLREKRLLEFGAGSGVLSALVCACQPRLLRSYELEVGICSFQNKRFELIEQDPTQADLSYLDESWGIISNPPYSELPFIRDVIEQKGIKNVILMVGEEHLADFPGYTFEFVLPGNAFNPPASGRHFILRKGFNS